jgi:hypothetical protein
MSHVSTQRSKVTKTAQSEGTSFACCFWVMHMRAGVYVRVCVCVCEYKMLDRSDTVVGKVDTIA